MSQKKYVRTCFPSFILNDILGISISNFYSSKGTAILDATFFFCSADMVQVPPTGGSWYSLENNTNKGHISKGLSKSHIIFDIAFSHL